MLYYLAFFVMCSFPVTGAGAQTVGGMSIITLQSYLFGVIGFGISVVLGVIRELQKPEIGGAYNFDAVLGIMVQGLEEELQARLMQVKIQQDQNEMKQIMEASKEKELDSSEESLSSSDILVSSRKSKRKGLRKKVFGKLNFF